MLDSGYATYRPKDRQAKPWRRASNLTSKRVVSTVELIPDVAQRRVNITVKYREVCPTKVDAEWRGPHAAPNLIPVSINRQESQRPDGEKAYIRRFRSKNIPNIFDMIVVSAYFSIVKGAPRFYLKGTL